MLPYNIENYFRYSGSLTTPGCDEKVEWFVVDRPILTISEDQLLSFQDLEDNHGFPVSFISFYFIFWLVWKCIYNYFLKILTNSRPIQEVNDRLIKRSFVLSSYKRTSYLRTYGDEYNFNSSNNFKYSNGAFLLILVSIFVAKIGMN